MDRTREAPREESDGVLDRSAIGVCVLHGFTSTTQSVAPLADALAAAGYGVDLPLLPGHGTDWRDLAGTPHRRILRAALASWDRTAARHRAVAVVGLSMGGALALHVAARRDVLAVVAINPGLRLKPGTAAAARLLHPVVASVAGVAGDIAREEVEEVAYPRTPVRGVVELDRLARTVRRELPLITCPILLARSASDSVLPASAADTLVTRARRAPMEQLLLPRSRHVATLDHDAELLARRAVGHIDRAALDRAARGHDPRPRPRPRPRPTRSRP
ncbi:alpha/beta hydrolase [Nesterenkonia marinintestina]|uniref:alpha/beta hydrolase n=1 Tax=Nesterenkonia marinintestina TaxID=2979865 RepID=UPI0021C1C7D0|nr:alpha/beta fold hydrolase [Nesterenkonia sp. GX14115]